MKRYWLLIAFFLLVFLCGFTLQSSHTVWEYHSETAPSDKKLNELGQDGWELVAVATKGGVTAVIPTYVFKRQKN